MLDREKQLSLVRVLARSGRSQVLQVARGPERLALKIVFTDGDAQARLAFEREAAALSGLDHPCVARVIEHGEGPTGLAWLLMPFYDGLSLADRLRTGRPLSPRRAVRLFGDYLAGLGALHEAGLVHRDVTPQNLFIARRGKTTRGVVMDLGRAWSEPTAHASAGHVAGLPAYLAPEQLLGGRVDARTDVFAAGLCLFEALAAKPALSGVGLLDVLDRAVPSLTDVVPRDELDPISRVIARATRLAPDDRWPDAASFAAALARAAGGACEEAA